MKRQSREHGEEKVSLGLGSSFASAGREGPLHWWEVGGRRVEMYPTPHGWEARVQSPDWGGSALRLDGRFESEEEAEAWCHKIVATFAADDAEGPP